MRGEMHLPGLHLRLLQESLHLGGLQLPSTCSITHIFLKVHTPGYKSQHQLHQFGLNLPIKRRMAREDSLGSARTAMVLQDSLEASLAPPPHLQPQDRETPHLKGMDEVE